MNLRFQQDQADEWQNAYNDMTQILDYSINQEKVDFPVDNWLYGIARVRDKNAPLGKYQLSS